MIYTKSLLGSVGDTQRHAGGLSAIPGIGRLQAGVAVSASLLHSFAEIGKQGLSSTTGNLAQTQHGIKSVLFSTLKLFVAI